MAASGASVPPPPPPIITEGCVSRIFSFAGRTFPQSRSMRGTVSEPGQVSQAGRSDDVLGSRWKLILLGGMEPGGEVASAFSSLVDIVALDGFVCDDTCVSDWFSDNDLAVALVRPDAIVFGASSDSSQIEALLAEARDFLSV
jgi:hypothetical protein